MKRDEWVNATWHCSAANLFGWGYEFDISKNTDPNNRYKGITWHSFMGIVASMKKVVMKIRPKNFDENGKIYQIKRPNLYLKVLDSQPISSWVIIYF